MFLYGLNVKHQCKIGTSHVCYFSIAHNLKNVKAGIILKLGQYILMCIN